MKFGVSASRFRVKIIQTKKQWIPCARHGVARRPYRRLWPSARHFHASAIAPKRRSSPFAQASKLPVQRSPFLFLRARVHGEPKRAELVAPAVVRRSAAVPRAPTLPNLEPLSTPPPSPSPSSAEPHPGRNRPADRRPPLKLRPELRPSRRRPPSGHPPPQIDSR